MQLYMVALPSLFDITKSILAGCFGAPRSQLSTLGACIKVDVAEHLYIY
jgi:hypothetical protein